MKESGCDIFDTPKNGALTLKFTYAGLMSHGSVCGVSKITSDPESSATPIFEPESCYIGGQRPMVNHLPYRSRSYIAGYIKITTLTYRFSVNALINSYRASSIKTSKTHLVIKTDAHLACSRSKPSLNSGTCMLIQAIARFAYHLACPIGAPTAVAMHALLLELKAY